jgi:hypothetical protein
MSYSVTTLNKPIEQLLIDIRQTFGLNKPPYNTIDNDLLILAFIPTCNIKGVNTNRLRGKFGTCSHQSLEFYGDRILYNVIISIIYNIFGLDNNPEFLTKITNYLTSNRTLTDLMIDKNACRYVRRPNYVIKETGGKFHNPCADSLEALIGALFVHFSRQGENYVLLIREWMILNTNIIQYLGDYLDTLRKKGSDIYTLSDKQYLLEQVRAKQNNFLDILEAVRENIGEENYQFYRQLIEEENMPTLNDFATKTLIVPPNDTLTNIYSRLNWKYERPTYDSELSLYEVCGYPNGKKSLIGSGFTLKDAVTDAYEYLVLMGYIITAKSLEQYLKPR